MTRLLLVAVLVVGALWPALSFGQSTAYIGTTGVSAPNWHIGPWPTLPSLPHWPTLPNFISGPRYPQPTPIYVTPTPYPPSVITVPGGQCPAGTHVINQACTANYPNPSCTSFCASNTTTGYSYSATSSSVTFVNRQGTAQSTVWQSGTTATSPQSTITVQGTQCPAGSQLITMSCTQNYPNPSCMSYCQPVVGTSIPVALPTYRPSTAYIPGPGSRQY